MDNVLSFANKASLVMLLMNIIMAFVVDVMSAEWVILVIGVALMTILFVVSLIILKRREREK